MRKSKPRGKTSAQTSGRVLIAQPHGGALGIGGTGAGGRPKNVLRAKCRTALLGTDAEEDGVLFVARVMRGTETEDVRVDVEGAVQVVQMRPKVRDRLFAFELLADRGWGRPEQGITFDDDDRPPPTGEERVARILELLPRVMPMLPVNKQEIARLLAESRRIEIEVQGREVDDD